MFPKIEEPDKLQTPLGPASEVWATSEAHIGMHGTFTINRVVYDVRLDLHYRDGQWQEGYADKNGEVSWSSRFHALMIDREWDWSKGKRPDTSSSARNKAREALVPWLAEFAVSEGAEMIRRAGCEDRQRKIESKLAEIEKLRDQAEQAARELDELNGNN